VIEPQFNQLGAEFKDYNDIKIGHLECDSNKKRCQNLGINGYPTLKGFVSGRPQTFNGNPNTVAMQRWLLKIYAARGSGGGSSKCRAGMFKGGKGTYSVVPLCEAHFPDEKAKNDWTVFFYDHSATEKHRDTFNQFAEDLADNEPGFDQPARVGAVCCDCDDEHKAFCDGALRQGDKSLPLPQVFFVSKGVRTHIPDVETDKNPTALVKITEKMMGHKEEL